MFFFLVKAYTRKKWYRFCCGLPFGALGIVHRYSGFILRTLHIVGFVLFGWLVGWLDGRDGRSGGRAQSGNRSVGRSVGRMDDIYIYIYAYSVYTHNIYIIYIQLILSWPPRFTFYIYDILYYYKIVCCAGCLCCC